MRAICTMALRSPALALGLGWAASLCLGAQVPAMAQRAGETAPLERAMNVPRPALPGGAAGLPQPLAPSDAARLVRIFSLQKRGDMAAAAQETEPPLPVSHWSA